MACRNLQFCNLVQLSAKTDQLEYSNSLNGVDLYIPTRSSYIHRNEEIYGLLENETSTASALCVHFIYHLLLVDIRFIQYVNVCLFLCFR